MVTRIGASVVRYALVASTPQTVRDLFPAHQTVVVGVTTGSRFLHRHITFLVV